MPLAIIGLVCPEARVKFKKTLIFGLKPISPVTVPGLRDEAVKAYSK